jgi:hypothetical protein
MQQHLFRNADDSWVQGDLVLTRRMCYQIALRPASRWSMGVAVSSSLMMPGLATALTRHLKRI